MPWRRVQDLAEMERNLWLDRNDPRLWPTIAAVWSRSACLCPARFPPGLYRHRSIEEANQMTEAWEAENVGRQTERSRSSPATTAHPLR